MGVGMSFDSFSWWIVGIGIGLVGLVIFFFLYLLLRLLDTSIFLFRRPKGIVVESFCPYGFSLNFKIDFLYIYYLFLLPSS